MKYEVLVLVWLVSTVEGKLLENMKIAVNAVVASINRQSLASFTYRTVINQTARFKRGRLDIIKHEHLSRPRRPLHDTNLEMLEVNSYK